VAEVSDVTRHKNYQTAGDRIIDMIEKPAPDKAPGCLGAIGVYVFEPSIFDAIRATTPGFKSELQFTGSIKGEVVAGKKVIYRTIDGIHIDVGTPHDLMRANEWYLKHNDGN
jgi:UDP-N-acetylglucosamine diphosphorylase / glucose-1-phosphate thymidylyltransferase / UDP-N-acetylgalactosamine diphosphorylase / glucosamine-1-phosphate N-acetyltransferase / galactosamine-1-phosphate N-acetyltransferase